MELDECAESHESTAAEPESAHELWDALDDPLKLERRQESTPVHVAFVHDKARQSLNHLFPIFLLAAVVEMERILSGTPRLPLPGEDRGEEVPVPFEVTVLRILREIGVHHLFVFVIGVVVTNGVRLRITLLRGP